MINSKYVFTFGDRNAEGHAGMKELLGGKGANLAEMNRIGIPVPPGFTITTEACKNYYKVGKEKVIADLQDQVRNGVSQIEKIVGTRFGDANNPCLLSVRSGAQASMPGMMDTVLNLGLNDEVVAGMAKKTGNPRLAWDSYRRFIQMYGDVVMGLKPESKEDQDPFEVIIHKLKEEKGVSLDTELSTEDLKEMTRRFRKLIRSRLGRDFPSDPWEQLWGSITAVFDSWMTPRAIHYRRLNNIPGDWGTAVNVQAMVFGNMGDNSATGVAFTRDPATGENLFVGEYLVNAQGEDVVAGTRTPQQITKEGSVRWAQRSRVDESERRANFASLEEIMPTAYQELYDVRLKLEDHYREMQDLEFTIQDGKLWILQTRTGKRTGAAMVKIGMDMLREGRINEEEMLLRMDALKLDELLHPVFDNEAIASHEVIADGLPASPGAASGQIVFFADDAAEWTAKGKDVILVRIETSPEDIEGMHMAKGILTTHGGMTSHAAVVARGMGTCCVSGAGSLQINYKARTLEVDGKKLKEGDWISLNGSEGLVYEGKIKTREADLHGDFEALLKLSEKYSRMGVRANADTPHDAMVARKFGAEGIGLCRTEHMFFEGERIALIREMILSENETGRRKALDKLLPIQRKDFEGLFEVMDGQPITVRLLDPPLHEFLPQDPESQEEMARDMGITVEKIRDLVEQLSEINPMLGLRGCRVGNLYPEITEMQTRAIIEAALNMKAKGIIVFPEIMVPLISTTMELKSQKGVILEIAERVFEERGERLDFHIGTMIEVPRAALVADLIAENADFFSFGTNDLTQMTYGFSRDDIAHFLPQYLKKGLLRNDPFQQMDPFGVGKLVRMGTELGRKTKPELKVGICGEHGGDPSSIELCEAAGLDYVSCSPYRVPIARLVTAQVAVKKHKDEPVMVS